MGGYQQATRSAICYEAEGGNTNIVGLLLDRASESDIEASKDALIHAVKSGKTDMVDVLITRGFDVNHFSKERYDYDQTELLAVCNHERDPHMLRHLQVKGAGTMLRHLLAKGADMSVQGSRTGDTPRESMCNQTS